MPSPTYPLANTITQNDDRKAQEDGYAREREWEAIKRLSQGEPVGDAPVEQPDVHLLVALEPQPLREEALAR